MLHRLKPYGFSTIEVIIAILLLGIMSAVAVSRMMGTDSYNAFIVRDQIVSMARSAQQKAIGRSDVVLTIQPDGDNLDIFIEAGVNGDFEQVQSARTRRQSVSLRADVDELASCAAVQGEHPVTNDNPMVIAFDALGDVLHAGVLNTVSEGLPVTTGLRICVNSDPLMSVCISRTGFAYVGDCDD